jgi:2-hydroxy-6-oxonona-2,4-dienedioate hydrolase
VTDLNSGVRLGYAEIDGVPTRYFEAGARAAPALLLVHGLTLNAEIWLRNLDALGCRYRVIAPDMLGHGFSGPPDASDAPLVGRKVAHLLRLMDYLRVERFSACGSSYGGLVSALLYFKDPKRLHRLVINGSGSAFNTDAQMVSNLMKTLELKSQVSSGSLAFWRERVAKSFHDKSKAPMEMATSLMTSYGYPWAPLAWEQSVAELLDPEVARGARILHRLEQLDVETLVLWGRQDPGAKLEHAEAAVARMPRAQLQVFEDCGHFPMLEHPDLFNRVVAEFLA